MTTSNNTTVTKPTITSRLLSGAAALAAGFASKEIAVAQPYVDKALSEIGDDIKASKPLVAFGHTFANAAAAIYADPAQGGVLSFTGLFGAVASAFL